MWLSGFYLIVVVVVVVIVLVLVVIASVVVAIVVDAAAAAVQDSDPAREKSRSAELAESLWFQLRPLPLNVSRLISGEDSLLRGEQYVIIRCHLYLPPPGSPGGQFARRRTPTFAFPFFFSLPPVFHDLVCCHTCLQEPRGLLAQPVS